MEAWESSSQLACKIDWEFSLDLEKGHMHIEKGYMQMGLDDRMKTSVESV